MSVWIELIVRMCFLFHVSPFFFFFFFDMRLGDNFHYYDYGSCIVATQFYFLVFFNISVGPVYYSRDLQTSFFNNFFIKNGSHYTIYIFNNYFIIIFLVFSFSKISSI